MFAIEAKLDGIEGVDALLGRLDPLPETELLTGIARLMQEQTRHRILAQKTAPDGAAWKANRAGTPTLHRSGALARSIDYAVSAPIAKVGTGLIYAAIHQNGGVITPKNKKKLVFRIGNRLIFASKVTMPPRPYLGVSAENALDIMDAVILFVRGRLGGAA